MDDSGVDNSEPTSYSRDAVLRQMLKESDIEKSVLQQLAKEQDIDPHIFKRVYFCLESVGLIDSFTARDWFWRKTHGWRDIDAV